MRGRAHPQAHDNNGDTPTASINPVAVQCKSSIKLKRLNKENLTNNDAMVANIDKDAAELKLEKKIGLYPDFPIKGVLFRDIMPILGEPDSFNLLVDKLADLVKHLKFDRILGIESRGFLIGPSLALKLNLPFGPIRKRGKLPGELYSVQYELEYGHDVLEVQKNGLPTGSKCLIVDDLIATGGSLEASKRLVEMSGSNAIAFLVVIELKALKGVEKLGGTPLVSLFSY